MVQSGDVIRVTDMQTLANVSGDVINTYFFEVASIPAPTALSLLAADLETWMLGPFLTPICGLQAPGLLHRSVKIDNMMDFVDDYVEIVYNTPKPGIAGAEYNSSVVTFSFQFVRGSRLTRHGRKALGGIPESFIANNQLAGTAQTQINAVLAMYRNIPQVTLTAGGQMALLNVIAKSVLVPPFLPTVFNSVIDVAYRGIGTQNSRKQLIS